MDAKLLEVMVTTIVVFVLFWLVGRLCFRVMKILANKGPIALKYFLIIGGIIVLIWIYRNPNKAKLIHEVGKSLIWDGNNTPLVEESLLNIVR